ncbi:hypothetical protein BJX76DRAFT_320728 [Aspergillus varians]
MDQPIIDFFTRYAVHGKDIPIMSVPARLPTRHTSRTQTHNGMTHTLFVLDDNLFQITRRVLSLHFQARSERILSTTTICRGVELWSELDNWALDKDLTFVDHHTLHELHICTLFLWLHLIIHSDNFGSDKTQDLVANGLERISDFQGPRQLCAVLLVPLFIHGVASVRKTNRDAVDAEFTWLKEKVYGKNDTLETYRAIVHWTWRRHDARAHQSWDWTDWVDEDLL